jgi:hypothetical protein
VALRSHTAQRPNFNNGDSNASQHAGSCVGIFKPCTCAPRPCACLRPFPARGEPSIAPDLQSMISHARRAPRGRFSLRLQPAVMAPAQARARCALSPSSLSLRLRLKWRVHRLTRACLLLLSYRHLLCAGVYV